MQKRHTAVCRYEVASPHVHGGTESLSRNRRFTLFFRGKVALAPCFITPDNGLKPVALRKGYFGIGSEGRFPYGASFIVSLSSVR